MFQYHKNSYDTLTILNTAAVQKHKPKHKVNKIHINDSGLHIYSDHSLNTEGNDTVYITEKKSGTTEKKNKYKNKQTNHWHETVRKVSQKSYRKTEIVRAKTEAVDWRMCEHEVAVQVCTSTYSEF